MRMRTLLPISILTVTASLLVASPATAQSDATQHCMALGSDAEKVECLREALQAVEDALAQLESGTDTPAPAPPPAAAPAAALAQLGEEQLATRQRDTSVAEEAERFDAAIVDFRESVPGRMMFQLDNGQVWQQTAADAQRLQLPRGSRIAVELWGSWSGGYRMLLKDQRRVTRVERLR